MRRAHIGIFEAIAVRALLVGRDEEDVGLFGHVFSFRERAIHASTRSARTEI
jgi:hypothetical protein